MGCPVRCDRDAPEDFDAMYTATPPWDIGRPQPAFVKLARAGVLRGRVVDVGCGTGEHVLMAADLGLEATGIDLARAAIATAEGKARERGVTARFLIWNALQLEALNEQFDTVLDSGLFHVLEDADRPRLVDHGWRIDSIEATKIDVTYDPDGAHAWAPRSGSYPAWIAVGVRRRGHACAAPGISDQGGYRPQNTPLAVLIVLGLRHQTPCRRNRRGALG